MLHDYKCGIFFARVREALLCEFVRGFVSQYRLVSSFVCCEELCLLPVSNGRSDGSLVNHV